MSSHATIHLLKFDVGDRQLALPVENVHEVVRVVAISVLPRAPRIVEGVINFRGMLVPVLDVRQRFQMTPRPISLDQYLLIARAAGRIVALRIDRAVDVVAVPSDTIRPAAYAPGAEHVAGLALVSDGVLVIQDLERFLSLDEAREIDAALASTPAGGHRGA